MIRLFFATQVDEPSEEVLRNLRINLSPVHHGVAIAFNVSGMILGRGDVVLILC